jgi:CRISP-associated protein Cas1
MAKRSPLSKPDRGLRSAPARAAKQRSAAVRQAVDSAVAAAFEHATEDIPSQSEAGQSEAGVPGATPSHSAQTMPRARFNEPLPARMLNEFVYCPRLFYYEHVEGVFVHNADTTRGAAIHKRVDSGSGALPPAASKPETEKGKPENEEELIHSRSVSLGSDRLGVTAKIDLVEVRGGVAGEPGAEPDLFSALEVCPVDYKAGAPRAGDEGKFEPDGPKLWDADKMQLGLQCLLLRDNGYRCNEGIIYYRATKQRVRLTMTDEIEAWVLARIRAARECTDGPIPPPLIDSPKCPRCSLVTVCLPDETRLLAQRSEPRTSEQPGFPGRAAKPGEPRRLIAARDDTRALYLNTPGLFVGRSGEVLQIKDKKELVQEVRIGDLSHVALFGNIQISTAAVQALCEADVPITYFSMGGWFYGITRGHSLRNVFTRVEQFRLARDPAVRLWLARSFILGKIRNQRTMLMRNHLEPPQSILAKLKNSTKSVLTAQTTEELLGIEGAAAAFYFQNFSGMLKIEDDLALDQPAGNASQRRFNFDFAGRKRRPPTDPVNALLSLAYSLLAKDCTIGAAAVGLDPYVGFYHQPRFGRPALALDVMEEFRPLIAESSVLSAINTRMVTEKDFVRAGKAVNLSAAGRKQFFIAYEARMNHLVTHPIFDYKVTYRRAIELQFRILARYLTGEVDEYVPFMTR